MPSLKSVPTILHIDMDAFFASVEQLDHPELRGKPLVVGGASKRGVVAAASYEVRPFGVRSAMPMVEALRRCPQVIVVTPRHERYAEVSAKVFEIFERYTPLVEGLSLDEAFLDVTASQSLFGDGETIAARIREDIRRELGLTASAGVARSKFVAKIASDMRKPDGLFVVPLDVAAFLAPLPIERMWGVGEQTAVKLRSLGATTFGTLHRTPLSVLQPWLGSWAAHVQALAVGEDARAVVPDRDAKSIGSEETFERDLRTWPPIERALLEHAATVAKRLCAESTWARVVRVKLKYADFTLTTRQAQLDSPAMDTDSIFNAARELARDIWQRGPVRLVGVTAADLSHVAGQLNMFDSDKHARRERVETVTGNIRNRFGALGITRAALLPNAAEGSALRKPRGK